MSANEFGLGGWWPRPAQAAVGALDHLLVGQWPELAAMWLAAGYDSQPLRKLAKLPAGDTRAVRPDVQDLMHEAMRSIGFDPAPADAQFRARCQQALDLVQHDLDATGYDRYRMQAHPVRPGVIYASFPDGSYWSGGEGMSRKMEGSWLLFNAAESVSATIEEWHEIEWPVCAAHSDDARTSWEPVALIKKAAWWQCTRARHALAPVGQLTAQLARTEVPRTFRTVHPLGWASWKGNGFASTEKELLAGIQGRSREDGDRDVAPDCQSSEGARY